MAAVISALVCDDPEAGRARTRRTLDAAAR